MTSLGFPGLSSQSVSGFFGFLRPENPETDWDDKPGLPRVVIPVRVGCFLTFFGQKTPKRTGMTSLGFPGLSSQSVSGFVGPVRPENPETDWDDKTGLPRVVIPVCFGFFGPSWPENPETDWTDKPGFPRVVIPVCFGFFWALFGQKTSKRTGMTSLRFPGLSSQSVSVFWCPIRPENHEMDWDDKPGLPRVVIPVRFGFF